MRQVFYILLLILYFQISVNFKFVDIDFTSDNFFNRALHIFFISIKMSDEFNHIFFYLFLFTVGCFCSFAIENHSFLYDLLNEERNCKAENDTVYNWDNRIICKEDVLELIWHFLELVTSFRTYKHSQWNESPAKKSRKYEGNSLEGLIKKIPEASNQYQADEDWHIQSFNRE